jgi:glucose/arabinose dehydrogenase
MQVFFSPLRILIAAGAFVTLSVAELSAGQATPAGQPTSRPAAVIPASDSEAIPVQGHERLAWDQRASSPSELATLGFVGYVNGTPRPLAAVSCSTSEGLAGFECSSALPALEPGLNVIEIAAHVGAPAHAEGQRSLPIHLRFGDGSAGMVGVATTARTQSSSVDRSWTAADGTRLRVTEVATGLEDATDLLSLPDGRVMVAERVGRVRILRDGLLPAAAAVTLDDVMLGDGRGLLALTAAPDFSSTRHVFASYTTESGLRIARFTVGGDRLVDRAVVLDGLPIAAVRPAALLRSGPDGRLYLATDDGGDPERLYDLGSYSGKVLRFATDGTTPPDQPGRSPVWSVGVNRPVGLAWSAERAMLRVVGVEQPDSRVARAPSSLDFTQAVTRFSLPPTIGATRAAIGAASSAPVFRDQLFVGSANERAILKVSFDGDVPSGSEWLLRDLPGPVTALATTSDGAIYAAVGPTLLRIVAEP